MKIARNAKKSTTSAKLSPLESAIANARNPKARRNLLALFREVAATTRDVERGFIEVPARLARLIGLDPEFQVTGL